MTATVPPRAAAASLTAGRYQVGGTILTVTSAARSGDLLIWHGQPGRLRGPRRVHHGALVATVVRDRVLDPAAVLLLRDPAAARARYATKTGRCSRCGRPLTDPTSRATGVGRECERKEIR